MKMCSRLVTCAMVLLFSAASVNADSNRGRGSGYEDRGYSDERGWRDDFKFSKTKAPEIDAASATVPLALLTGLVLLIKERSRSRRSIDSDK